MATKWLNYHHLLYFWTVAREGSISAASRKLHLAQPTISSQLKKLERRSGGALFERVGRSLVLTDLGHTVYKYADEIFSIGQELAEVLEGRPGSRAPRLRVGIPEVLPKLIAFRLLQPVLSLSGPLQLDCQEGAQEQLLAKLAANELDVVFSDAPATGRLRLRVYNHALGECGVGLFATRRLARRFSGHLPGSLSGAPFLLPSPGTSLRRSFDQWHVTTQLTLKIVGEFDDTALMKVFAEADVGFVPSPLAIENDIEQRFSLHRVLTLPHAKESFYAITADRKLRHPAIVAISDFARASFFDQQE